MSGPILLSSVPVFENTGLAQSAKEAFVKSEIEKFIKNFNLNLSNNNPKDLPFHIKKIIPNASIQFIEWLVGFTDAEGSFSIHASETRNSVYFRFGIELHVDDIEILYKIAQTLGIGRVIKAKNRNTAYFYVNHDDIIRVIIPIFQEFPLQTSKHLDFICFYKAVLIKFNTKSLEGGASKEKISETDIIKIKKLKESMNGRRFIIDKKQEDNLRYKVSINMWWLLGFVEGEGTFGYKHLVPYFQIAQHKKNLFVLNAIETYLSNIFKEFTKTVGSQGFKIRYTLNNRTGVYSMTEKIDTIFSYIVPLFESMSFFTRKSLDYRYWVLSVVIHRFGYYYLPEGKKIALQISSATNKYRYSTSILNKTELPSDDNVSRLLAKTPPFDITNGRSHFELAREITISKGGRKGFIVYINGRESEGYKELKGSPFSSYGAGHVAIGLKPGSRVIGRYIDTGKAYKDKYIFSSIPL